MLGRILAKAVAKPGILRALLGVTLGLSKRWAFGRRRQGGRGFPRVERRRRAQFQILFYHRVNDDEEAICDTVPVRTFAVQMELLKEHFCVLPLLELVEAKERNHIPPNAVAITFDDGYRDNYENAFPVLRRLGLPATIFVTTGSVASRELLWHDQFFDAFAQASVPFVSFNGGRLPLRTVAEKRAAVAVLARQLRKCDPQRRIAELHRLVAELKVPEPDPDRWRKLDWDQIREMAGAGISFGAHTVTHPILTRVPREEAAAEIEESRKALETQLGSRVTLFAYPNGAHGDFDESVKQVLRDAGFRCAVTTVPGVNDTATDPLELRREAMWDPLPQLAALRLAWSRLSP
jgi:peptidoglycan/xylan/chitin deacetylase (PgdA/CDA1 family)